MTLLYVALAYFLGLAAAHWWWNAAAIAEPLPASLWLLPLLVLPCARFFDRLQQRRPALPMRWPPEAGFEPPDRRLKPTLLAAAGLCFIAGFLRYGGQPPSHRWTPADLAYYNLPADQAFDRQAAQVTVSGCIDNYPVTVDGKQELLVAATSIRRETDAGEPTVHPVQGAVRVTAGPPLLHYGQQVAVRGRLSQPAVFEDFSYKDYLARQGVGSVLYNGEVEVIDAPPAGNPLLHILYSVRRGGEALIARYLPEPYAALANGMLLGLKAGIPPDLYEQFNLTGTSHVIVISGTNVALISGVIIAVLARLLGRRRALWPTLAAVACYALLVGGEAAVLRAAVMGGLFVTATALGRRSTALVSLAAACLLMTLANPLALWDVGLQMSSMGTAGLVLLAPFFAGGLRRLFGRSWVWLRVAGEDVLSITLGASLATLPLVLFYFGRLSLVSLPANLLIAQVQPLILLGGSAALVAGLAGLEWLAQGLLWLPWLGLAWTVAAVQWCAALPLAALDVGGFGLFHLALSYSIMGVMLWHRPLWATLGHWMDGGFTQVDASSLAAESSPTAQPRSRRVWARLLVSPPALAAGAVLAALLWAAVLAQPDGRLHVWFLDVGQGDGILIQTPAGRQVLIDGGAGAQALSGELGAVMPFWDRTLDLVILTHPDADHMAAQVEAAGRFTIDAAWETVASAASADSAAWQAAVAAAGADVQLQQAGGWADLGDGVALWVLGPPAGAQTGGEDAKNGASLVARLVYGDFSVLLTGDAEGETEMQLLSAGTPLQSTVLKVAHHGSKHSSSAPFVAAVNPALAIIQVGENRYGHPDSGVLDRLAGRTILRTDEDGRIEVSSDGRQVWVEREKG